MNTRQVDLVSVLTYESTHLWSCASDSIGQFTFGTGSQQQTAHHGVAAKGSKMQSSVQVLMFTWINVGALP